MLRAEQTVEWMRTKYPFLKNRSDDDLYEIAKLKWPGADWEESPFIPSVSNTAIVPKGDITKTEASPQEFEKIDSYANLTDAYAKEGIPWLGISPEAMQEASNSNISGLLYQIKHGKQKYAVDDYDKTTWESVAGFFLGMLNPVDALAFVGSMGGGSKVASTVLSKSLSKKFVQKSVAGSFRNKLATDPATHVMTEAILGGTIGLGSYSAATGAISETSKQATEIKNPELAKELYGPEVFADGSENPNPYKERTDYNIGDIFKHGVAHGAEGALLGGVTAGTGKFIGNRALSIQRNAKGAITKNAAKLLNYPVQIGVEAGEFTTIPYLLHGGPKNAEQFYEEFFTNVGIIGAMKLSRAPFESSHSDIKAQMGALKKQLDAKKTSLSQGEKSLKDVKNDVEGQVEPGKETQADKSVSEILKLEVNKEVESMRELLGAYEDIDKALSKTNLNLSKDKLTLSETKELFENGVLSIDLLDGWVQHMKEVKENNPSLYEQLTKNAPEIKENAIKQLTTLRDNLNKKAIASEGDKLSTKKAFKDMDGKEFDTELNRLETIVKGDKVGSAEGMESSKKMVEMIDYAKKNGILRETTADTMIKNLALESPDFKSAHDTFLKQQEPTTPKTPKIVWDKKTIQEINQNLKKKDTAYSTDLKQFDLNTPEGLAEATKAVNFQWERSKVRPASEHDKKVLDLVQRMHEKTKIEPGTEMHPSLFAEIKKEVDVSTNKVVLNKLENQKNKIKGLDNATEVSLKSYLNFQQKNTPKSFEAYSNGAIRYAEFLKNKKKKISNMTYEDAMDFAKDAGILKGRGKSGEWQGYKNYIDHLQKKGFITGVRYAELKDVYSIIKQPLNKYRKESAPAKENIRQNALKEIVNLSNEGKVSEAYSGMLVVDYMLRAEEVGRLKSRHIKMDGKDYYIDANTEVRKKSSGFDRVIYLEKDFAKGLKAHLEQGNKLKTTEFVRMTRKHANTQDVTAEIRRRGHTLADLNLDGASWRQYMFLQGHGKEAIENVYGRFNPRQIIEAQKIIRKQMGIEGYDAALKNVKVKGEFKFQFEPIGEATMDASVKTYLNTLVKRNPGLKVAFEKDKAYAGKFLKDVIYLTEGKANIQTFFHENGHRFESFIRRIGDKEMIKLWERGEKMYAKEAKKAGQTANEYFTDRVADYGTGMSKGVRNKIVSWSKLMMTKIKKFFFGKDNLNKRDIKRLLGEKVYKGFGTENTIMLGEKAKFQINDVPKFAKHVRDRFNELAETIIKDSDKMDATVLKGKKHELVSFIAKQAGIENHASFRIKTGTGDAKTIADLQSFFNEMSSANLLQYSQKKDIVNWLRIKGTAEKARLAYNVNLKEQGKILQHIGIKSGLVKDASVQQLKEYVSFMNRSELTKVAGEKDWIQEAIDYNLIGDKQAKEFMKLSETKGLVLPVQSVLKRIGLGKLADRLYDHGIQEWQHVGRATTMENNIATIVQTKGKFKNNADIGVFELVRGQTKFKKIQDMLWLFDKEQRLEHIELDLLSSKEKKFVSQAFQNNGKGDVIKGSIAEMIQAEINSFNKYFREQMETSAERNMNPAEFEQWKKDGNIEWIEDGVYVHRSLTKEFYEIYRPDSQALESIIQKRGLKLATKMAKEKNPGATTQELRIEADKMLIDAKEMVRSQMHDLYTFSNGKVPMFGGLKQRHEKLPAKWYSEEKGKYIQVYEKSYDATFKKYALGMSKYISNVEFFPEHVNLKGLTSAGVKTKLEKLRSHSSKWADYTEEILSRQLGIGKHSNVFEESFRNINTYAQFLAKTQLAFPTAGLKNFGVGQYQNLYAFKLRHMVTAVTGALSKEKRAELRGKGITEIGIKHIDNYQGYFKGALEKGFRLGLMKPTENINRYISVLAGRADQVGLVNVVRSLKSGRKYNKAMKRLKDFYRLTDADIKLLKKYGLSGTDGIRMDAINRKMLLRKLNQVYNKMDASAHVYTQGATVDLFMPYWAGSKGFKPLTLYKRMAYAASVNTYNNMKAAFTQGDMMKIAVGSLAAYGTGEMLLGVYDTLLGQDKPNQNSGWWDKFMMATYRAEFGGVLSEFWNPANESKFEHSITPAIWSHATDMTTTMLDFKGGKITFGNTIKEMLRKTSSPYNAFIKVTEKKTNPVYRGYTKYNMKYNEFMAEYNPDANNAYNDYKRSVQTPVFKDLKTVWYQGKDDEFMRVYINAVVRIANDEFRKGMDINGKSAQGVEYAFQRAEERINKFILKMNPNKGSFYKFDTKEESTLKTSALYLTKFLKPEERDEVSKLEKEFFHKYRQFFNRDGKIKPELLAKHNIKPFMSKFDWK